MSSAGKVEAWEDGMRTSGAKGTFEWWYLDSEFTDGSKMVIVFFTKSMFLPQKPLEPFAKITFDGANGTHIDEDIHVSVSDFSSSTTTCDVRMGENRFVGDLNTYKIDVKGQRIQTSLTLTSTVEAWKPAGNDQRHFCWLPAVPAGTVDATITIDGATQHLTGEGYHDHNWGDQPMNGQLSHWYWGRANAGAYEVISVNMTGGKAQKYEPEPVFMLAHNGKVIADDTQYLTYTASDRHVDDKTKKPVYNTLVYDYNDGQQHYKITYHREHDLVREKMTKMMPKALGLLATLTGFDGAYLRFSGLVVIEHFEGDAVVERVENSAIWELMFFDHDEPHPER